jgi:hypothetical protein
MSRPYRHARSRKAIARQLVLELVALFAVILLVAIALPIYLGADPGAVAR